MYNVHFSSSLVTKETMRLLGSQPKSGQGTIKFAPFSISGTCSIKKTALTSKMNHICFNTSTSTGNKRATKSSWSKSVFFYLPVAPLIETALLAFFNTTMNTCKKNTKIGGKESLYRCILLFIVLLK